MLNGTVHLGDIDWDVHEEKRAGPQAQLFVLTAADSSGTMHVRSLPGASVTKLEEVALLAADPEIRWFNDADGAEWEARLVLHSEPNAVDSWRVKFISARDVLEGLYRFKDGLGRRTADELRELLKEAGG